MSASRLYMSLIAIGFGILIGILLSVFNADASRETSNSSSAVSQISIASKDVEAKSNTSATDAMEECDRLASDPRDPSRMAVAVGDEELVPIKAISACQKAVELNPSEPRAKHLLGRSLWHGGRQQEAVLQFSEVVSDTTAYPASALLLGDAFFEGRGLPAGIEQDTEAALGFYQRAADMGVTVDVERIEAAREYIKKNRFDPSLFQNRRFISILYHGNFNDIKDTEYAAFRAYVSGMIMNLGDEQTFDHSPECVPRLDYFGTLRANIANGVEGFGFFANTFLESVDVGANGGSLVSTGLTFTTPLLKHQAAANQGEKDARLIAGPSIGCAGGVGKTITQNLMKVPTGDSPELRKLISRLGEFQ